MNFDYPIVANFIVNTDVGEKTCKFEFPGQACMKYDDVKSYLNHKLNGWAKSINEKIIIKKYEIMYGKNITIYTDGAYSSKNDRGGWCSILICEGKDKVVSGHENKTTNNRMELMAAVGALSSLKKSCIIELYSDSKYLVDAFEKRWIAKWMKNGWMTKSNTKVKNEDLWKQLYRLSSAHRIEYKWVKGHNGNVYNEKVDEVAAYLAQGGS